MKCGLQELLLLREIKSYLLFYQKQVASLVEDIQCMFCMLIHCFNIIFITLVVKDGLNTYKYSVQLFM